MFPAFCTFASSISHLCSNCFGGSFLIPFPFNIFADGQWCGIIAISDGSESDDDDDDDDNVASLDLVILSLLSHSSDSFDHSYFFDFSV